MADRITVRIDGQNIGGGDPVIVAFSTKEIIIVAGLVGEVCRMRLYDELTGESLREPELWFTDFRTDHVIGPVTRNDIDRISVIDGPFMTDRQMVEATGDQEASSGLDCGLASAYDR